MRCWGTFQNRVGLQDLIFDLLLRELPADRCQVLQDQLGALCFPRSRLPAERKAENKKPNGCTGKRSKDEQIWPEATLRRLSPDDAALISEIPHHVEVAGLGDGEDVRGEFSELPTVIQLHLREQRESDCLGQVPFIKGGDRSPHVCGGLPARLNISGNPCRDSSPPKLNLWRSGKQKIETTLWSGVSVSKPWYALRRRI